MSESFTKSVIQTTLEKDYKDAEFVRLMRENIIDNIENNKFYRNMVKNSNFNVDDLNSIDDLASVPFISTAFYKQSANLYKKLLKIPEHDVKHWNCSSTTSGDPSLVGVNEIDIDFLNEMSRKCFLDFIPRDWNRAKVFLFSPNAKMLDRFCIRFTKERPVRAYSGNYYKVSEEMTKVKYLFSFSILKALQAIIKTRSIVGGFYIKQTYLIKSINKNLKQPEEKRFNLGIGGSNFLITKFMEFMRENDIRYNFGNEFDLVVGGGGWDGQKAQLKYNPINKSEFVSNIADLFGTERKRVIDIFGFTECPIVFGSHWSDKHEDFIFHCPQYSRILIRDIKNLEPLKKEGDRGFLEVLTPFGNSASIKHAVTVDDNIELISKHKCPECGREGDTFKILGRIEESEGIGCSSLIKWI
ncbi:MAG: hypothetical protein ACFFAH_13290 [Promethearchaeota archaeon]